MKKNQARTTPADKTDASLGKAPKQKNVLTRNNQYFYKPTFSLDEPWEMGLSHVTHLVTCVLLDNDLFLRS